MKLKNADVFTPIGILLIVLNLIALNIVSSKIFGRIDLTETGMYTLSNATKKTLKELPAPLTIKAYFTKDLPAPYNNIARFVEDQLSEMKALGKGNFRFEFHDPGSEEKLRTEADAYRLEPMQVNEMRADKVEYKLAYMGMVMLYEDRREVIPAIQSLDQLEYEIVSKIKRITQPEKITIGFLEGHDELRLRENMTTLDREIRKLYDLKPVSFEGRSTVPPDINLLVIMGPKKNIPEKDRFAIDQFIMRGGKLFIASNMVDVDMQNLQARRSPVRINQWIEHYGIRLQEVLALDRKSPTLPFQTMTRYGRQVTLMPYPLFPEIVTFNRKNIAMKNLRQVRLYYPSVLDTTAMQGKEHLTYTPLMWTSPRSAIQYEPFNINPTTLGQDAPIMYDQSSLPMAAVVSGKFTSFYAGKPIPLDEEGNAIATEAVIPESPETRIAVIADGNFVNDQYLAQGIDNLTAALNIIDWMVQDEELITIRSRDVASRPIAETSEGLRNALKYINLLVPPLLVVLFGVIRWRIRRSRQATQVANFTKTSQSRGNV